MPPASNEWWTTHAYEGGEISEVEKRLDSPEDTAREILDRFGPVIESGGREAVAGAEDCWNMYSVLLYGPPVATGGQRAGGECPRRTRRAPGGGNRRLSHDRKPR